MRIYNHTNITVDRDLWAWVAAEMGLRGNLPKAVEDDTGFYRTKQLIVVIKRLRDPAYDGTYCGNGCVELTLCPRCTGVFALWTYLHELVHVWLDQYGDEACFKTRTGLENFCDAFANSAFAIVGGRRDRQQDCFSYRRDRGVNWKEHQSELKNLVEKMKRRTLCKRGRGVRRKTRSQR